MRKQKRKFSQFLAAFLSAALLVQPGMTAFAAAGGNQEVSERDVRERKERTRVASGSNAEKNVASDSNADISEMSLLPLEEEYVYVRLYNYSVEDLHNMKLETILSRFTDYEGNAVEIPADAEVVWTYVTDADGNKISGEYDLLDREQTVDLLPGYEGEEVPEETLYFDMIIGSGKQLDPGNIRYYVNMSITETDVVRETVYYSLSLYKTVNNDNGYHNYGLRGAEYEDIFYKVPGAEDIPTTLLIYGVPEYEEDAEYSLRLSFNDNFSGMDIQTEMYPMNQFLAYKNGEELTGKIEPEFDWDGCGGIFASAPEDSNAENLFCLVYKYNGEIVGYRGLAIVIQPEEEYPYRLTGTFYTYEDGHMKEVSEKETMPEEWDGTYYLVIGEDSEKPENGVEASYTSYDPIFYQLSEGYSEDQKYYYALEPNENITKIVPGSFDSIEEIEISGVEDISEQIFYSDGSEGPFGYLDDYNGIKEYKKFTVVYNDNYIYRLAPYYREASTPTPSGRLSFREYDDAPLKGNTSDPYFRMDGAKEADGTSITCMVADTDTKDSILYDTYYRFGYQTLFIPDDTADLSDLRPTFRYAENARIHSGEEQISGESKQDFSEGPVQYTASIYDEEEKPAGVKNYFVSFVKKATGGAKLFVNGPEEREIYLDDYFDNRHDILIANIGDADMTGLKAELLDPVHVKMDDYWTVGGEKNDTLGAYDEEYVYNMDNLARIRLVPDGEGEISGTLKISADGQEPVYIKLTGFAQNPKITTESLADGVKYVPYSYVIATNNIHDWNQPEFYITEGKLPQGLKMIKETGEIYGIPKETGEFPIKVTVRYSRSEFEPSEAEFTLKIAENTNANVYGSSDEGYDLEVHIGMDAGNNDYYLNGRQNQLFVSAGELNEFQDLWLNGERLEPDTDYEKEEGSTRITIKSQTFQTKASAEGSNTIAAEFRVDGDRNKELKRTAQNFRLDPTAPDYDNTHLDPPDKGDDSDNDSDRDSGNDSNSETSSAAGGSQSDAAWEQNENGWRCKNQDGSWITDSWSRLSYQGKEGWYFFDAQGYMMTGWLNWDGAWYYLNPNSDGTRGQMVTGWRYIDDVWYYFNEAADGQEGRMTAGGWRYLPYNGKMDWYYFDTEGRMMTGWIGENGRQYYLHPISDGTRGHMLTGWQQIEGKWYYFSEASDGTRGAMQTDAWIGNDYVNEKGIWEE